MNIFPSITYQFVFVLYVSDDDNSGNSGTKGKDDNNEINNIVPGLLAEENFWCQGNDSHEHLSRQ